MKMNEIKAKLLTLGMNMSLKGTAYLASAIKIYETNKKITGKNGLYETIAKENNDTASRVERAIRHSIEVLFEKVEAKEIARRIKEIFGVEVPVVDLVEKPANSELIAILAFAIEYKENK